ncbi:unnamed protein product [Cuscuta epithymum]|uniref:Cytochrome P450 n=1 Tax=Cuscuta epithymum TaxID=186058 RepID=A0AAV0EFD8_9ASTE|nr:unnamed protein product [Cuscuta epithymum]
MILYESLRLYPPVASLMRKVVEETKLGEIVLPPGAMLSLPMLLLHLDSEIWGEDVKAFKPERFKEGIMTATLGKNAFFPFGLLEGALEFALALECDRVLCSFSVKFTVRRHQEVPQSAICPLEPPSA